ncbi:M protein repeat protein [Aphelenchoides besseyi]|nr:M protein repeat protein [Aphelenchoides besseyi]
MKTEGEMREKIKRLEESMAELQSEKKRIGNRLEETKALSNAECRTSQSMTVRLERDSEARSLTVSLEREAEARVQLEAEIRSLKQNLQRREQDDLDEIRSQHQRRIRTYEEQVTDLNETVANLQSQLRSFEQRSRQFETQSQNSFESSTHDYKREYRKTLALLKDAQNLLSIERQKSDKTPMLRRLQRQLETAEEEKLSAIGSRSTLESELAEKNVEIETVRSGKAALEKRVSALLQEKSDAMNNARDIEEQLNNALRDYNNHLLQTETNNLTIQRQAVTIAELESEKQRLALQLGELESKNSHFHSHYVEAHKITLLESKVRELQSRVEYERCEKQKYEANVNRLQDEVDRLEDRLNDFQRLVNKHEDEVKRQKLAILAEQEKLQDTKKTLRRNGLQRDLLEEKQLKLASLCAPICCFRIVELKAALNTGLDNDEEDSDLDDELNDLDESDSAVTATTGSIVIQTSPQAMSTTQESENGPFNDLTQERTKLLLFTGATQFGGISRFNETNPCTDAKFPAAQPHTRGRHQQPLLVVIYETNIQMFMLKYSTTKLIDETAKRVIEVASIQQRTDGNRRNESGTARSSFDATLSPPSTTAGEPSTPPFIMEPSLKRAQTEGEMREKIKRLEESMAELQSEKKRIGNRLEETKALSNAECRTSQSMTVRLERDSEARSLTVSLEREAEARVQLEAEIRSLKQNLQRREQDDLDEIRSQHQRRIRTYEEQVTDLNETVANLQSQLRSFEQRSRQFETQSQNSFESSTHDYKREYRKTLALLKDAQNLFDKTPMLRRLQRQLETAEEEKLSAIGSRSTLESELAEKNVEIETVRSGKAALEKRVSALLQEKSDAMNNARDIEEQLNNALRDYNNHLLQTETNNLTIQRQAVTIAELESEKQRLALQLGELESKNSHFHSHYVEAHKITLLESKVRELQSRVEYERCEKQKYEANVNRLQDEVDRLEDRLNDFQRLVNKHEDEVKRQKLAILAEQEKLQDTKKRYDEMDYKFKKTRDLLEETTETCESLRSDLLLSNRRVESLQAALNTGLDNDEEDSDLDDELNDLDESDSAVTATTGSIVIQTSPRAMSTFAPLIWGNAVRNS